MGELVPSLIGWAAVLLGGYLYGRCISKKSREGEKSPDASPGDRSKR